MPWWIGIVAVLLLASIAGVAMWVAELHSEVKRLREAMAVQERQLIALHWQLGQK